MLARRQAAGTSSLLQRGGGSSAARPASLPQRGEGTRRRHQAQARAKWQDDSDTAQGVSSSAISALLQRQVPALLSAVALTWSACASGTGAVAHAAEELTAAKQPVAVEQPLAQQQQQQQQQEGGAAVLAPSGPVYDGARVISPDKEGAIVAQLERLERDTGWRVRALTSFGPDGRPSDDALRAAWKPDKRTVVISFDLSNPNLINPIYLGDEVLFKLRRPWWFELQGRYGNIFYVRDEGEQKAVLQTLGVVAQCLEAPEGCKVVPGLPEDQYQFTLALSIAGGIVAGSVVRLDPTGWIKERWQWLLVFFPLWGSLFINFGLGPIVSRTDDINPILANTAAFVAAAATPTVLSKLLSTPPPPPPSSSSETGAGGGGTPPSL